MMDERATDKLLADLFKDNAPAVDDRALRERISARVVRRRRRSRRGRTVRALALGFTGVVLAAAVFGVYEAVGHFRSEPPLVFTDFMPAAGDSGAGFGTGVPSGLVRVSPVMGTAVLERVKSEGTSDPARAEDATRWVRGRVEVYRLRMSQPAIDGTMEITSDLATRPNGSTEVQGSWVLRSRQGEWKGSLWTGIQTADGADQFYVGTAAGTGRLEGLVLILEWHSVKNPESSPMAVGPSEPAMASGWIQAAK